MELLAEETPTHNLEEEEERNKIRHWTRVPAVSHTENCGCLKSVSETLLLYESRGSGAEWRGPARPGAGKWGASLMSGPTCSLP